MAKIANRFNRKVAMQNDYLRQENKILRGKLGKRVPLDESERRLVVKYGLRIKDHLDQVVSIVRPKTLLAWHRRMKKQKWAFTQKRPGRPRKSDQTEKLAIRLAEDNGWGYRRIAGEMKKLGHELCVGTVRNILIKNGLPPAPQRKGMSWRRFIKSHRDVAWRGRIGVGRRIVVIALGCWSGPSLQSRSGCRSRCPWSGWTTASAFYRSDCAEPLGLRPLATSCQCHPRSGQSTPYKWTTSAWWSIDTINISPVITLTTRALSRSEAAAGLLKATIKKRT
jgi:hypothetical protein